jgi:hypothetical protein
MVSLLEMSAMSQEILMHLFFLGKTDDIFLNIEAGLYSNRLMNYLYNPHITEYSVCVHLVANKLNLTDPLVAFTVCAYISRLILNMPLRCFEMLARPDLITNVLTISRGDASVERFISGLKARDYGTLFFIFGSALSCASWNRNQPIRELIQSMLAILNISMHQVRAESQAEAAELNQSIRTSHFTGISTLAHACYENFEKPATMKLEYLLKR